MGNKKVEMTSSLSPQQQGIEKMLGNKISGGLNGGGVAPYMGPIASNPDALSLAAANMLMGYLGQGAYQLPTFQMGQNYGATAAPAQAPAQGQPPMQGQGQMGRQGYNPFQAR